MIQLHDQMPHAVGYWQETCFYKTVSETSGEPVMNCVRLRIAETPQI
jgi:hypothetical protein